MPMATFPEIINFNIISQFSALLLLNRTMVTNNNNRPGYAHASFSPKFLWAFVQMDPVNVTAKFELYSFTHSRDNSRYLKTYRSYESAYKI